MLLSLTLFLVADARISVDAFTETVYFAQEPAAALSSGLTIRQRNDDTGFALQAVGPCRGTALIEKNVVRCVPGASSAYTAFMREGVPRPQKTDTPASKELRAADLLVGEGKLAQAQRAYESIVKRGMAKVTRAAEISAAELCLHLRETCPTLEDFRPEGNDERERFAILRLSQGRAKDAFAIALGLRSLRAMILREHALAMSMREMFLRGDDLGLIAFAYQHEEALNAHGDARELRLLVMHAFWELEAEDALRAFVKPGERTFGMLPAVSSAKEGARHE